jgi:hypothetical protein
MAARTLDQVTREIAREREQLATAVAHLRGELRQAANAKAILRAQAPRLAAGAAVLVAGIVAKKLLSSSRSRPKARGRERFSLGRFAIVERG